MRAIGRLEELISFRTDWESYLTFGWIDIIPFRTGKLFGRLESLDIVPYRTGKLLTFVRS